MTERHTKKGIKYMIGLFFRSLLHGLVILGPIALTLYLFYAVFSSIDNIIPSVSQRFPGLVFISMVIIVALVGFLGTKVIVGRFLVDTIDGLLRKTPGVKYVYTSIRDVLGSFVGDTTKFNEPVWVKVQEAPEIWRIGFLTQKDVCCYGLDDKVAVYLPHSYAISGWVIFTDRVNVRDVKGMNAVEAMKFAVSGGVSLTHNNDNIFKAPE